jgi:hypothetical protein
MHFALSLFLHCRRHPAGKGLVSKRPEIDIRHELGRLPAGTALRTGGPVPALHLTVWPTFNRFPIGTGQRCDLLQAVSLFTTHPEGTRQWRAG